MEKIEINLNPNIPPLPKFEDKTKINVRYTLISPYVSVHIYWDREQSELLYEVEEPILNKTESDLLATLEISLGEMVNVNILVQKTVESMIEYIDKTSRLLIDELDLKITHESYKKIFYYLFRDFIGLNKIEPIMRDYFIEDIDCNGIETPLYIIHRVYRNMKTNVKYDSFDQLSSFVEKLAQRCNKYISYANPLLDGSLPDGSRVNATYTQDISSRGPTFTIRKFTKIPWNPIQLLSKGTVCPEMLAYFWILVEYKSNILIAGGTASGKTTLLNAIAFFIPPEARVVSIEDTRELNFARENWLPSVARTSFGEGKVGEIDLFSLLKSSFRQNPDYVIVGEVRGKEAYVLFQGMASGHSSISTMHADSVDTLTKRLSTPPIELSPSLLNTLDCVAIMTHAIVGKQETRKLREVEEIINVEPNGTAVTNTPFVWNPRDNVFYFKKNITAFEKISRKYGMTVDELNKELDLRAKLLYEMQKKNIFDFNQVQKIVNEYHKNPSAVLSAFGIKKE
ncbi:MAG: type II/IV secretion system ATPase subunit [Nanoarchaeota archaeon]|nr:type II/IV secretion system ATPase subunit [Nanoarchaeota archaeon]